MKLKAFLLASATAIAIPALSGVPAQAGVIDLTFEGINSAYPPPGGYAFIENFYNGGTSSVGTSGPNYGISFSSNAQAICLNSTSVVCSNTSRGGLGDPNSQKGGLFFLSGSSTFMDVPGGFTTGFSFNYTAPFDSGSVSVYSGLDGTGTLLATLFIPTTTSGPCSGYSASFCPFFPDGIGFSGTAESVAFSGVANQIVFDDVTFGSITPGTTPLPSTWTMLIAGFLGLGFLAYRGSKKGSAALAAA
jgi:hypothetical protein